VATERKKAPDGSGDEMLRSVYREELARAGGVRSAAMEQADEELQTIAALLPGATASGLAVSEIARIADVSRPTVYELLKDSGSEPDLLAALLAALIDGPHTENDLTKKLGVDHRTLGQLIGALVEQGWAQRLTEGSADTQTFMATDEGEKALADWEFSGEVAQRTTKTLRLALDVMRFSADERKIINRKVAEARAQGKERLGLVEAVRMGIEAERRRPRRRQRPEAKSK
jgi:DNA-binding MarR family transcriptional regulator